MADVPQYRALLDAIAGSESPGYNYIYGGKTFNDFSDHPRQFVPIVNGPNVGKMTSAAGRYQFLGSSWDQAKKALGLPDFSPQSQDAAAIWSAQQAYKAKTGGDLLTDLQAAGNDPAKLNSVGSALSGYWTSLPGGIEPNKQTGAFAQRYIAALGQPSAPNSQSTLSPSDMAAAAPQPGDTLTVADRSIPTQSPPILGLPQTPDSGDQQGKAIAQLMALVSPQEPMLPTQAPIFQPARRPTPIASLKTAAPYLGRGFYSR